MSGKRPHLTVVNVDTGDTDAPEFPCLVHTDTLLIWTDRGGYVCPRGCGWEQAGRRWKRTP